MSSEHGPVRRGAAWVINVNSCVVVGYHAWRAATLPPLSAEPAYVVSWVLFVLELALSFLTVPEYRRLGRRSDRSAEADEHLEWYGAVPPLVDVFIPTYNEPWSVIEKTIVGARRLSYTNVRVWLLDDGARDWLAENARVAGVGYLARTKREHAKAGNLNHALAYVDGLERRPDFVCVLDADFVAQPELLRRTLALMHDPKVGIVQTAQWFYNADPFQQALGSTAAWPDEQRYWFDVRLPALDEAGQATCCGTSCLIRAAALRDIGGFPTETLSEDTWCSIVMRRRGWQTHYLNEPLSWGLSAEGLSEYLTQRSRWMFGGMQMLREGWRGRTRKTVLDRLGYWLRCWRAPISALVLILWFAIPGIFMFTGHFIVEPAHAVGAAIMLTLVYADRALLMWWTHGRRGLLSEGIAGVLMWMWLRVGVRGNLGLHPSTFLVTPKAVTRHNTTIHWETLRWLLAFAVFNIASLGYLILARPDRDLVLLGWNLVHITHVLVVLYAAMVPTLEPAKFRTNERYPAAEPVQVVMDTMTASARLSDLSVGGAAIDLQDPPPPGTRLTLVLAELGEVSAVVKRRLAVGRIAVQFESSPAQHEALIARVYVGDQYVRPTRVWTLRCTLAALGRHAVALVRRRPVRTVKAGH